MSEVLGQEDITQLQEEARKFAAGIRFATATENLTPLNIETSIVDESNSSSDDSILSNGRTDYKSEALRLRVRVTTLEEEVLELQAALGQAAHQPSQEHFEKHLAEVSRRHELELEVQARDFAAERQRSQLLVHAAETKAADCAARLLEAQSKWNQQADDQAQLLQRVEKMRDSYEQQLSDLRQQLAQQEKCARDAQSKALLLQQRVDFVSSDRQQRLEESKKRHDQEVENIVAKYSKMLLDLKRAHTALQRLYEQDTNNENDKVTVTFVNTGKKKTQQADHSANPTSVQADLFGARRCLLPVQNVVVDENSDNSLSADGSWDGVQAALSLAKISHKKLAFAKKRAEAEANAAAQVSELASKARLNDIHNIEATVQDMLREMHSCIHKCVHATATCLTEQQSELRCHRDNVHGIVEDLQAEMKNSGSNDRKHVDKVQTTLCSLKRRIIETEKWMHHTKNLPAVGAEPLAAKTIREAMLCCCSCICQMAANYAAEVSVAHGVLDVIGRLVCDALTGGSNQKIRGINESGTTPQQLVRGLLQLRRYVEQQRNAVSVAREQALAAERAAKTAEKGDSSLRHKAAEQIKTLIASIESKETQLQAAHQKCQELEKEASRKAAVVEQLRSRRLEDENALLQAQVDKDRALREVRADKERALKEAQADTERALQEAQADKERAIREAREDKDRALRLERDHKDRAVYAEKQAAADFAAELEKAAEMQQEAIIAEERAKTRDLVNASHIQITKLKKEHAAKSGQASAELESLQRDLRVAKSRLRKAESECGMLEAQLTGHCQEREQLLVARDKAARAASQAAVDRLAVEASYRKVHHDWCASEAAVANLQTEQDLLRQQLDDERSARLASQNDVLRGSEQQLLLEQNSERRLDAVRQRQQEEYETAIQAFREEKEAALQAAARQSAEQAAALRQEAAAASAEVEVARRAASEDRRKLEVEVHCLKEEMAGATTFRDGEIQALRETLARNDAAQIEVDMDDVPMSVLQQFVNDCVFLCP